MFLPKLCFFGVLRVQIGLTALNNFELTFLRRFIIVSTLFGHGVPPGSNEVKPTLNQFLDSTWFWLRLNMVYLL